MSKLYNQYVVLKAKNPTKFFLFKSGIFFIFLDEDAKTLSKILKLKLGHLNTEVLKCGFPEQSIDKYMNMLKSLNYDVEIINNNTSSVETYKNYTDNTKLKELLVKIMNIDIDKLSISQAYDKLYRIQNDVSEIYVSDDNQ